MRSLLLKASATALTLVAAAASAAYVGGHVKNAGAPLRPGVVAPRNATSTAASGRLSLTPSVACADVQAVTSTYAS